MGMKPSRYGVVQIQCGRGEPGGSERVSMHRAAQDTVNVYDPVTAHADGKYQRIPLRGGRNNSDDLSAADQPPGRGRQRDRDDDRFGGYCLPVGAYEGSARAHPFGDAGMPPRFVFGSVPDR